MMIRNLNPSGLIEKPESLEEGAFGHDCYCDF